jgi:hypothetical protein
MALVGHLAGKNNLTDPRCSFKMPARNEATRKSIKATLGPPHRHGFSLWQSSKPIFFMNAPIQIYTGFALAVEPIENVPD